MYCKGQENENICYPRMYYILCGSFGIFGFYINEGNKLSLSNYLSKLLEIEWDFFLLRLLFKMLVWTYE